MIFNYKNHLKRLLIFFAFLSDREIIAQKDSYKLFFQNHFKQNINEYCRKVAIENFPTNETSSIEDAIFEQQLFLKYLKNKGQLIEGGKIPEVLEKVYTKIKTNNQSLLTIFKIFICKSSSSFSFNLLDNSIFFSTGLLMKLKTEEELQIIIAREMASVINKNLYYQFKTNSSHSVEELLEESKLNKETIEKTDLIAVQLLNQKISISQYIHFFYRINEKDSDYSLKEILQLLNTLEYSLDTTKIRKKDIIDHLDHSIVFKNRYLINQAEDFRINNINKYPFEFDTSVKNYKDSLCKTELSNDFMCLLNNETASYKFSAGDYFSSLYFFLNAIRYDKEKEINYQYLIENLLHLIKLKSNRDNFINVLDFTSANKILNIAKIRAIYQSSSLEELTKLTYHFIKYIYNKYPENEFYLFAFAMATEYRYSLLQAIEIYNQYENKYLNGKYVNVIKTKIRL